jgi:hypothetical protein
LNQGVTTLLLTVLVDLTVAFTPSHAWHCAKPG